MKFVVVAALAILFLCSSGANTYRSTCRRWTKNSRSLSLMTEARTERPNSSNARR